MEGSYSVSTNNRFAFFMDEEDDPGDMILQTDSKFSNESKSPKKTEVSLLQKKSEKVTKTKDQKPAPQPGKKVTGETTGGKRREVQFNEKNQQPKERSNEGKPRDNRRQLVASNGSNREGRENRPSRQNRGRERLPSREKQDGNERNESVGGNMSADDVSQRDTRSRPPRRNNDRFNRDGRDRVDKEDVGERSGGFRSSRPRGGGGFRGGKREFERRSGSDKTSVKPFDKKEGAGSHNWGTVKDELNTSGGDDWPNDETEQPVTANLPKDSVPEDNAEEKAAVELDPEVPPVKEEKEDEEMLTLEEYKARQEKKRVVPSFKERKPGENEDATRWKDTFVYERTDDELVPGTREVVEKYKSSGRVKTALESNFFFKDTSRFGRGGGPGKRGPDKRQFEERQGQEERDRRPRRSEGERRPRRFEDDHRRGGGNRARDRSNNFNVEDEKDFPSLGTVSA